MFFKKSLFLMFFKTIKNNFNNKFWEENFERNIFLIFVKYIMTLWYRKYIFLGIIHSFFTVSCQVLTKQRNEGANYRLNRLYLRIYTQYYQPFSPRFSKRATHREVFLLFFICQYCIVSNNNTIFHVFSNKHHSKCFHVLS